MATQTAELILKLRDELSGKAGQVTASLDKMTGAERALAEQAVKVGAASAKLAQFAKLETRFKETSRLLGDQQLKLKELGSTILRTEGPTGKLEAQFRAAEKSVGNLTERLDKQREAIKSTRTAFEQLSGGPLHSVESAESRIRAEIDRTTEAMGRQITESHRAAEVAQRSAERVKHFREMAKNVGMVVGPAIITGTEEAIKSGAELQHRRVEMQKAGMGPMVPAIEKQSLDLATKYKNVTQVSIMEMAQELRSVLNEPEEIKEVLPTLAAARSVLDARDPTGAGSQGLNLLVKGAENIGAAKNPERLAKLIDNYVKAMQVMGQTINPDAIYEFDKNARQAGAQLSDRFLLTTGLSLSQEMGGSSAGKAANQLRHQLIGGLAHQTVPTKELVNLGLIDPKDVRYNKQGEVSGVKPGVLHAVKGDRLLEHDPDLWVYQYLLKAMDAHGITNVDDQLALTSKILPGAQAADLVAKLITQRPSYEKHGAMFPAASGTKDAENQNRDDPIAALGELTKSLETFTGVVTSPLMKDAANALDWMAGRLAQASEAYAAFSKEYPETAKVISAGVLGVAGYEGLKHTYGLFSGLLTGFTGGAGTIKVAAGVQAEASAGMQRAAQMQLAAADRLNGLSPKADVPAGATANEPGVPKTPGAPPSKPASEGLSIRSAMAILNLGLAAVEAPDVGPAGDAARKANADTLDRLGKAMGFGTLDAARERMFGKDGDVLTAMESWWNSRAAVPAPAPLGLAPPVSALPAPALPAASMRGYGEDGNALRRNDEGAPRPVIVGVPAAAPPPAVVSPPAPVQRVPPAFNLDRLQSRPADTDDRLRERLGLIDEMNEKERESIWQFGQLGMKSDIVLTRFDTMSSKSTALTDRMTGFASALEVATERLNALAGLDGSGFGGGAGERLIRASYGGEGFGDGSAPGRGVRNAGGAGGVADPNVVAHGDWAKAGVTKGEVADYIRHQAAKLGIDPGTAVRVSASEGLSTYTGDYGTSHGPFQLHYGGSGIRGMNSRGMGDDFTRDTGLDARDPKTWKAQVDYALKRAAHEGWGAWHGAARVGIGNRQGIGTYHGPIPESPDEKRAQQRAAMPRRPAYHAAPVADPQEVPLTNAFNMDGRISYDHSDLKQALAHAKELHRTLAEIGKMGPRPGGGFGMAPASGALRTALNGRYGSDARNWG